MERALAGKTAYWKQGDKKGDPCHSPGENFLFHLFILPFNKYKVYARRSTYINSFNLHKNPMR